MRKVGLSSLFLIAAAAPAGAVPFVPGTGVTLGVTGGTLGIGPEASFDVAPLITLRGSATFFGADGHGRVGGYRYDGHLKLGNFGGSVDVHPFASGFRLSAGGRRIRANRIRFVGRPTSNQTYGGITYTPDQVGTLSGRIRAKSVAPIATVGYARTWATGITFGIDAGAMYQGRPRVTDLTRTGLLATNPFAQSSVATAEQRLRDKVRDYPWYPVLQLSLGYRF